ncbi:MAG: peptidylprolyl isomerase [Candidatus Marinimicrobia bacterium]|nr:peptidylprolyl isomerase [Candidatus Neomarinimicrobiota bacterium]
MGLMTGIRGHTQLILWILLILFVLSMTIGGLVGGANILDIISGKAKLKNLAGIVGKDELKAQDFYNLLQNELNQLRANGKEIDDQMIEQVSDRIWNTFVKEVILKQEVKKYSMEATDNEIFQNLVNNPPEFLQKNEAFQTDGKFDYNKYIQALTNPQGNEWLGVEQYMRYALPLNKITIMIQTFATVSDAEVLDYYKKTKINYDIETLIIPISIVPDTNIIVTNDETINYYNKNKEQFFVDESRKLKYVYFEIKPTIQDTQNALYTIESIKNRLKNGESFETLAAEYSEDPYTAKNGGDLGWFGKGHMTKPFEDAAFSAKKGEIVGPVLTQFGYHLIKINDIRVRKGKKEVKASHILIKIKPGPETIQNIKAKANLFAYDAGEYGFEAAADSQKIEIRETMPIYKNTMYIPGLGYVPKVTKFAFSDIPLETISDVFSLDNAFAVFKLSEIIPSHYKKIDEVKDIIIREIKMRKREEILQAEADSIYSLVTEKKKELEDLANENKKLSYGRHIGITLDKPIKGIGQSNKLIGAILELKEGEIAKPVKSGSQYIIVKLLNKTNFDEQQFNTEKEALRNYLLTKKRETFYSNWLSELIKRTKIVDNRSQILY